jgi:hypothetical protein
MLARGPVSEGRAGVRRQMSKARVEAFSDGVFAIAITLLVLTIAQPQNFHDLRHDLLRQWPGYAAAGVVVYTATIGVALVNAYACLAVYAALAVYYAVDPISRGMALRRTRR